MNEQEIIRQLLTQHRGRHNPITSGELKRRLGINEDDTNAKTRQLIKSTIERYSLPVVSSNRGYYWAETKDELDDCVSNYDSRIAGIERRKQMIIKNFKEDNR